MSQTSAPEAAPLLERVNELLDASARSLLREDFPEPWNPTLRWSNYFRESLPKPRPPIAKRWPW